MAISKGLLMKNNLLESSKIYHCLLKIIIVHKIKIAANRIKIFECILGIIGVNCKIIIALY